MSPVPPPRDARVHRETWNLLPWIVNGTAGETERRRAERHLAACPDCREELAFQRQVQRGIAHDTAPGQDPAPAPAPAQALARLNARIAQETAPTAVTPAPSPPRDGVRRWTGWVPALVAAVVVQAVGLGTLGGLLWTKRAAAPDAAYRTLGDAPIARRAVWRLVPAPTLQLAELRALLRTHGLTIVESSGDGAILGVAPVPGTSADAAVLQALRADARVLLAEPVAADASRGDPLR